MIRFVQAEWAASSRPTGQLALNAGRDIAMASTTRATGFGVNPGSNLKAGHDTLLKADGDIRLTSA